MLLHKLPAKIGVYVVDKDHVYLVDSGNDKDAGRKVRQILDKNGWHLTAILNAHSNADHIGGNRYLQGQTGCKVYSGGIEAAFTKYPVLEPSFLYGGYSCKDLCSLQGIPHRPAYGNPPCQRNVPATVSLQSLSENFHLKNPSHCSPAPSKTYAANPYTDNQRILQELFKSYGLTMNFEQYVLAGSTVRSYLSWLKDTGKLATEFQDNMLFWQRV